VATSYNEEKAHLLSVYEVVSPRLTSRLEKPTEWKVEPDGVDTLEEFLGPEIFAKFEHLTGQLTKLKLKV
jgi:hypothetical protein